MSNSFVNGAILNSRKLKPNDQIFEVLLVIVGILVLYVPSFYALINALSENEDQAQWPIVLLVVLYLFWQNRASLYHNLTNRSSSILGGVSFCFGLFCYLIGRSQDILILDIGSLIPVIAGILLITRGMPSLKAMWFSLFFILFMIPLPGFFLDAVTLPMKLAVSYMVEFVLLSFDYPIARAGVILQIGQYQLLVADACAGMHTLISLEALGLLYLNIVKHDSFFRNRFDGPVDPYPACREIRRDGILLPMRPPDEHTLTVRGSSFI